VLCQSAIPTGSKQISEISGRLAMASEQEKGESSNETGKEKTA
jgi:hypothetical protein